MLSVKQRDRVVEAEEKIYRELRTWFDTPEPTSHGGVAVGQLSVHQTVLFDKLVTVLRTAVNDVLVPR